MGLDWKERKMDKKLLMRAIRFAEKLGIRIKKSDVRFSVAADGTRVAEFEIFSKQSLTNKVSVEPV